VLCFLLQVLLWLYVDFGRNYNRLLLFDIDFVGLSLGKDVYKFCSAFRLHTPCSPLSVGRVYHFCWNSIISFLLLKSGDVVVHWFLF